MKRNKLFLIPLSALAITTTSVAPILASCSNKEKEVSEDYSLSIENETVEKDIWSNYDIDKYQTQNKQYVTFELKLNQPIYMEWKDEAVSRMVGLPWIDSKLTKITFEEGIDEIIDIDKNEIMAYPSADNQTITLFVPYSYDDKELNECPFEDGKLFTLDVTFKFYKGSGEQFENDQMTQISQPYQNTKLTVKQKRTEFVKAPKSISISLAQNQPEFAQQYELHNDGYTLYIPGSGSTSTDIALEFNDLYGLFTYDRANSSIVGNILTAKFKLSDNVYRFGCLNYSGDIHEYDFPIELPQFINMSHIDVLNKHQYFSWGFTQNWEITGIQLDTNTYATCESSKNTTFTQSSSMEADSEINNFTFKLASPLQPNQELHIYAMTEEGAYPTWDQPLSFTYNPNISFDEGYVVTSDKINQDNQFVVPQQAHYEYCQGSEIELENIWYAIECRDQTNNSVVWVQTIKGFTSTITPYTY